MADKGIRVPYNEDLDRLEALLRGVQRPGDFFVQGAIELPMPRVEVEGAGVLSFPIPDSQIRQLVEQATRAPYGRGEATILDETVRKVWQLPANKVRIAGKSWDKSFEEILRRVTDGLGCGEVAISAELYKLLVYDTGGFFKAHRDTEKAPGMFGTLVIVFPSDHRGGELVIRHAGRTVAVDMSTAEVSELRFAAFYADCEHEVRPVTEGNRVCLIYNLVQVKQGHSDPPLTAPRHDAETGKAAAMLREAFAADHPPAKLVWLLQHQYSPEGLAFAGLKGEDAALAKVLGSTAEAVGCAQHLGIVHIEESGAAQPEYESYRSHRWSRRHHDDDIEDASSESFEVIEVADTSRYVDQWRNPADEAVDFGRLPLAEGEVLPAGSLDDEEPDEQRLTEATGNEGASFERSYHRAALVIWPKDRFLDVLLQAGVGATLPYLSDRVAACSGNEVTAEVRQAVIAMARRVIDAWNDPPLQPRYDLEAGRGERAAMLGLLGRLGDADLLQRFVAEVVTRQYDGSENEPLATNIRVLGPARAERALPLLVRENMRWFHGSCVELLRRIVAELGSARDEAWTKVLRVMAGAIVSALPELCTDTRQIIGQDWWRARQAKPVDARMVASLFKSLNALGSEPLRADAVTALMGNVREFDPVKVGAPALAAMRSAAPKAFATDPELARLWRHVAEFLLARSEQPPAPPTDWRQDVTLGCNCADCRELQAFTRDPVNQIYGFRVRQDRRSHLEAQIRQHGLDMQCRTDRAGSPQTLVCTKTRQRFQSQCEQHRADRAAMEILLDVLPEAPNELAALAARMGEAIRRRPEN